MEPGLRVTGNRVTNSTILAGSGQRSKRFRPSSVSGTKMSSSHSRRGLLWRDYSERRLIASTLPDKSRCCPVKKAIVISVLSRDQDINDGIRYTLTQPVLQWEIISLYRIRHASPLNSIATILFHLPRPLAYRIRNRGPNASGHLTSRRCKILVPVLCINWANKTMRIWYDMVRFGDCY